MADAPGTDGSGGQLRRVELFAWWHSGLLSATYFNWTSADGRYGSGSERVFVFLG